MEILNFMKDNLMPIILILVWLYALSTCKRSSLAYHRFFIGSVGLFTLLLWFLKPRLTTYLAKFITLLSGIVGKLFSIYETYPKYGMIFVESKVGPISLYVDYECAGLVEIIVFISLVAFFPLFKKAEKWSIMTIGTLWIIVSNVVRIATICCVLHFFGANYYYLAHTIIGRLVFYFLMISLYFVVFTKKQILRQKVGNFDYATNVT